MRSHRQVYMQRHENQHSENYVYFELQPVDGVRSDGYYMTKEEYEIFGEPDGITITVVPGRNFNSGEIVHREAGTGQFVSEKYAEEHPGTTVKETNG